MIDGDQQTLDLMANRKAFQDATAEAFEARLEGELAAMRSRVPKDRWEAYRETIIAELAIELAFIILQRVIPGSDFEAKLDVAVKQVFGG